MIPTPDISTGKLVRDGAATGLHGFTPALTTLVGRDGDLAVVNRLLDEYRLVTVTGPGGVGRHG